MQCTSCHTELLPQARFCHVCRTPALAGVQATSEAPVASDLNPLQAIPYLEHAPSSPGTVTPIYQPYPPTPPQPSHMIRNLIIVIVALAVLLMGAGALLVLRPPVNPPVNPAPSVVTTSTATPTLATDPQTLYTQVTGSTPTVSDPLSTQGSTTWQSAPGDSNSSCHYTGGALHIQGATRGNVFCFNTKDSYSDFGLEVQMTILQGGLAGIAFREDPFSKKAYLFAVSKPNSSNPGIYVLFPIDQSNGTHSPALSEGTFPAQNIGQSKSIVLTVIARSNSIYLYINGKFVVKVEDRTSVSGLLGLLATSATTPADVAYSNLKIWKL